VKEVTLPFLLPAQSAAWVWGQLGIANKLLVCTISAPAAKESSN